jgi:hypothetical protein
MVLLGVLQAACASTELLLQGQEPQEVSWEEDCQDDTTLKLVCSEDICAFFRCKVLSSTVVEGKQPVSDPAR